MTSPTSDHATDVPQQKHLAGHQLAWNSLLNLGTSLLIIGLNIVFVPILLHTFGKEFYGVLSVTWMVLANFSWLDFGFSRASARFVAQELAIGRDDLAASWTVTAVASQAGLGGLAAASIWCLAPVIVTHIHVEAHNQAFVILTLKLFALSIPLEFANRSLTGVMQAGQRFDWVNGLGIFNTISTYCIYGVGVFSHLNVIAVVYGLFVVRIVNLVACFWGASRVLPGLRSPAVLTMLTVGYRSRVTALLQYGFWIAAAAVVVPSLMFCDQWMITVLIGVAHLPYYTVPSNLLWRLGVLPNSLTATLFPAFSAMEAQTSWPRIERYFIRAHRYLLCAVIPILFTLYVWGAEILRLWIGPEFSLEAIGPLRILSFGFLIGLAAPLSGALLEAAGRPDLLTKLYLVETPFNIMCVWLLTKGFGVNGAALSYTVRTVVETTGLVVVLYRIVPLSPMALLKKGLFPPLIAVLPLSACAYCLRGAHIRDYASLGWTALIVGVYLVYVVVLVLDQEDRTFGVRLYKIQRQKVLDKLITQASADTGVTVL